MINFNTNRYFNLPNGTVPYGNTSYTITHKTGAITTPFFGTFLNAGDGANNVLALRHTQFTNFWSGSISYAIGNAYVSGTVATSIYDSTTSNIKLYWNSSTTPTLNTTTGTRTTTNINNMIGYGTGYFNYYFNGEMDNLSIFNTVLNSSNLNIIQNI
jgi:hypothetical protein